MTTGSTGTSAAQEKKLLDYDKNPFELTSSDDEGVFDAQPQSQSFLGAEDIKNTAPFVMPPQEQRIVAPPTNKLDVAHTAVGQKETCEVSREQSQPSLAQQEPPTFPQLGIPFSELSRELQSNRMETRVESTFVQQEAQPVGQFGIYQTQSVNQNNNQQQQMRKDAESTEPHGGAPDFFAPHATYDHQFASFSQGSSAGEEDHLRYPSANGETRPCPPSVFKAPAKGVPPRQTGPVRTNNMRQPPPGMSSPTPPWFSPAPQAAPYVAPTSHAPIPAPRAPERPAGSSMMNRLYRGAPIPQHVMTTNPFAQPKATIDSDFFAEKEREEPVHMQEEFSPPLTNGQPPHKMQNEQPPIFEKSPYIEPVENCEMVQEVTEQPLHPDTPEASSWTSGNLESVADETPIPPSTSNQTFTQHEDRIPDLLPASSHQSETLASVHVNSSASTPPPPSPPVVPMPNPALSLDTNQRVPSTTTSIDRNEMRQQPAAAHPPRQPSLKISLEMQNDSAIGAHQTREIMTPNPFPIAEAQRMPPAARVEWLMSKRQRAPAVAVSCAGSVYVAPPRSGSRPLVLQTSLIDMLTCSDYVLQRELNALVPKGDSDVATPSKSSSGAPKSLLAIRAPSAKPLDPFYKCRSNTCEVSSSASIGSSNGIKLDHAANTLASNGAAYVKMLALLLPGRSYQYRVDVCRAVTSALTTATGIDASLLLSELGSSGQSSRTQKQGLLRGWSNILMGSSSKDGKDSTVPIITSNNNALSNALTGLAQAAEALHRGAIPQDSTTEHGRSTILLRLLSILCEDNGKPFQWGHTSPVVAKTVTTIADIIPLLEGEVRRCDAIDNKKISIAQSILQRNSTEARTNPFALLEDAVRSRQGAGETVVSYNNALSTAVSPLKPGLTGRAASENGDSQHLLDTVQELLLHGRVEDAVCLCLNGLSGPGAAVPPQHCDTAHRGATPATNETLAILIAIASGEEAIYKQTLSAVVQRQFNPVSPLYRYIVVKNDLDMLGRGRLSAEPAGSCTLPFKAAADIPAFRARSWARHLLISIADSESGRGRGRGASSSGPGEEVLMSRKTPESIVLLGDDLLAAASAALVAGATQRGRVPHTEGAKLSHFIGEDAVVAFEEAVEGAHFCYVLAQLNPTTQFILSEAEEILSAAGLPAGAPTDEHSNDPEVRSLSILTNLRNRFHLLGAVIAPRGGTLPAPPVASAALQNRVSVMNPLSIFLTECLEYARQKDELISRYVQYYTRCYRELFMQQIQSSAPGGARMLVQQMIQDSGLICPDTTVPRSSLAALPPGTPSDVVVLNNNQQNRLVRFPSVLTEGSHGQSALVDLPGRYARPQLLPARLALALSLMEVGLLRESASYAKAVLRGVRSPVPQCPQRDADINSAVASVLENQYCALPSPITFIGLAQRVFTRVQMLSLVNLGCDTCGVVGQGVQLQLSMRAPSKKAFATGPPPMMGGGLSTRPPSFSMGGGESFDANSGMSFNQQVGKFAPRQDPPRPPGMPSTTAPEGLPPTFQESGSSVPSPPPPQTPPADIHANSHPQEPSLKMHTPPPVFQGDSAPPQGGAAVGGQRLPPSPLPQQAPPPPPQQAPPPPPPQATPGVAQRPLQAVPPTPEAHPHRGSPPPPLSGGAPAESGGASPPAGMHRRAASEQPALAGSLFSSAQAVPRGQSAGQEEPKEEEKPKKASRWSFFGLRRAKDDEMKSMKLDSDAPPEWDPVAKRYKFRETAEEQRLREMIAAGPPLPPGGGKTPAASPSAPRATPTTPQYLDMFNSP